MSSFIYFSGGLLATPWQPLKTLQQHQMNNHQSSEFCKGKHQLQKLLQKLISLCDCTMPKSVLDAAGLAWFIFEVIIKTLSITKYPLARPYACNPTSIKWKVTQPGNKIVWAITLKVWSLRFTNTPTNPV